MFTGCRNIPEPMPLPSCTPGISFSIRLAYFSRRLTKARNSICACSKFHGEFRTFTRLPYDGNALRAVMYYAGRTQVNVLTGSTNIFAPNLIAMIDQSRRDTVRR